MSSRFYFGDDSAPTSHTPTSYSGNDEDNDLEDLTLKIDDYDEDDYDALTSSLPFPKPLSRPSFFASDFEPHTFLASLSTSNRFQTLEDLQAELRELSTTINKELVDLVNGNYEEFVSLGADLRGGEEKVEEVRVGLLGFEKDIKGIREKVVERRTDVAALVTQKKQLRREVGFGRGLLEIDERLTQLEVQLGLGAAAIKRRNSIKQELDAEDVKNKWSAAWDDADDDLNESDEEYANNDDMPGPLRILVDNYLIARSLIRGYDPTHPFLVAQRERIQQIQEKVRIELESVIRGTNELEIKQRLISIKAQMDV